MMRNMGGHRDWELSEGFDWTMWQVEQLAAMQRYRLENYHRFGKQFSDINKEIAESIKRAYAAGGFDQEAQILQAIAKGFRPPRTALTGDDSLGGAFFGVNHRKMDALLQATMHDMEIAETSMLRMADDQYRRIAFNAQVYANSGAGTLHQAIDMASRAFLAAGFNCIEYKNGARVGIDAYAEMAIRTANKRAYLHGEGAKRQEFGVTTVVVHGRVMACPSCMDWVGRVYIDDVWSGGTASDGDYPMLSEAIEGGLYHPNCQDIHSTYYEGISAEPKPPTEEEKAEAVRKYEETQKLRTAMRREQRWERTESGSLTPENKRHAIAHKKLSHQRVIELDTDGLLPRKKEEGNIFTGEGMSFSAEPELEKMKNEFPGFISPNVVIDDIGSRLGGIYDPTTHTVTLGTHPDSLAAKKESARQYAKGYWSTPDPRGTIYHELSHAMIETSKLNQMLAVDLFQFDVGTALLEHFKQLQKSDKIAEALLSRYGAETLSEMVCESIAEYMSTSKTRPFAREVVELVKKGMM